MSGEQTHVIEGEVLPGAEDFEEGALLKGGEESEESGDEGDDPDDPEEGESESSTDEGEEGESDDPEATATPRKVAFTPEQQEVFNRVVGQKTHRMREAERRADQLAQELEMVRANLQQVQRPVIPDLPEPWEDDYAQRIAVRDQAIREAVAFDMQQALAHQQQVNLQQQIQQQQQESVRTTIEVYTDKAKQLGIKAAALKAAGTAVLQTGIDPNVAHYILTDEFGPLITLYLAKNPHMVERMQEMTPTQAAVHVANVVKPRALAVRKQAPTAPKPARTLGRGGAPRRERGPAGARYE